MTPQAIWQETRRATRRAMMRDLRNSCTMSTHSYTSSWRWRVARDAAISRSQSKAWRCIGPLSSNPATATSTEGCMTGHEAPTWATLCVSSQAVPSAVPLCIVHDGTKNGRGKNVIASEMDRRTPPSSAGEALYAQVASNPRNCAPWSTRI